MLLTIGSRKPVHELPQMRSQYGDCLILVKGIRFNDCASGPDLFIICFLVVGA